ncbi:MAG TPA: molybdate ABC transporter permease subunit [Galbitalea sp.]|jgi:molybdate transport system permease protein|nr:molybdate ABC transporter permease subunit [Galbitalea sp.]
MRASSRTRSPDTRGTGIPGLLWVPAGIALAFLVLPLVALVAQVPWGQIGQVVEGNGVVQSLALSLGAGLAATVLSVVFGVPLAWVLARSVEWNPVLRRLLRAFVTVPLVLPPVVGGIALVLLLGRTGLVGTFLRLWFGIQIPFTTPAVIISETFVAMPFLVLSVEGALRGADRRLEDAAETLGASRWMIFRRITLPLIAPGVAAGAVLSFARALGEFGATITFAGDFPGVTRTMPIAAYIALESDPGSAYVIALILLVVAVGVLFALRDRWVGGLTS